MDKDISLVPGQNFVIDQDNLTVEIKSAAPADFSAFRLYVDTNLTKVDEDFVFYGQPKIQDQSILLNYSEKSAAFKVNLNKLAQDISRVAFCVTSNSLPISRLGELSLNIRHNDLTLRRCIVPNMSSRKELALILGELYRYGGQWKFRFVAQGFIGGLAALAEHFGVDLAEDSKQHASKASPQPNSNGQQQHQTVANPKQAASRPQQGASAPKQAASRPQQGASAPKQAVSRSQQGATASVQRATANNLAQKNIDAKQAYNLKAAINAQNKINTNLPKLLLNKDKPSLEINLGPHNVSEFKVNLCWPRAQSTNSTAQLDINALLNSSNNVIAGLELGAYIKFSDKSQFIVQSLGNHFGSIDKYPFVQLSGDNRLIDGVHGGKWLYFNTAHLSQMEEIVLFSFIYDGFPNWNTQGCKLKISIANHAEVELNLSQSPSILPVCALARLTNQKNILKMTRIEHFFEGHVDMDSFFGWNFVWRASSK